MLLLQYNHKYDTMLLQYNKHKQGYKPPCHTS